MTTHTSRESSNGAGPEGAVSAGSSLAQMAGRLISAVAEQAQRRVPSADLDERDPDYIREADCSGWQRTGWAPRWWRASSKEPLRISD